MKEVGDKRLPSSSTTNSLEMETANPSIAVPWSDLPPELLAKISKRLHSKIDVRRFRAVCSSWRSSSPPYKFPVIKLPFPFIAQPDLDPKHIGAYFTLTERIVYRIQLPDSKDPDFWLVKVELDENGKARILNPVTHRKIEIPPAIEALNFLDFDVSEVCRAYALRYVNPSIDESDDYYNYRYATKVVYSGKGENGEYDVMAIDPQTRLWHIKSGDEKWSFAGNMGKYVAPTYDVAMVKGQFHATDLHGGVHAFDSEFGWQAATCPFTWSLALKSRLVELYNGELALVQEMPGCFFNPGGINFFNVKEPVIDVRVYALSKQLRKWVDAKQMKACIIVVGDDCSFSVPTTQQLNGPRVFYMDRYQFVSNEILGGTDGYTGFECDCREVCNCYYDIETIGDDDLAASEDVRRSFEGFYGGNIGVFDFETGKTGTALMFPEYASIFWPPPAWLVDASSRCLQL
ncbi:hypothetical protein C2S52_020250 [Perilla frutescens var. hirtella]|nr:hypothetical protein C2S52_020250 [Perilla frutescens var. hirtella]KAH6805479.1 hypothetical protein C2S51_030310 [Perilla frutescens var. frutescens]